MRKITWYIWILAFVATIQGCASYHYDRYGYANSNFSSLGKSASWGEISPKTASSNTTIAASDWSSSNDLYLEQNINQELAAKSSAGSLLDSYNYDVSYQRVPVSGIESSSVASAHEFEVSMTSISFPPGSYDVSRLTGVIKFGNWVANLISKMQRYTREHGADIRYLITYTGIADGQPTNKALYHGEFGAINIESWQLNGYPQSPIFLMLGQKISNPELALLRAYAGQTYLQQKFRQFGLADFIDSHLHAETHSDIGRNSRLLKIRVEVLRNGR